MARVGSCLAMPGRLEFGTLLLPAGMQPVDKFLCIVFGCLGVNSSAGAVFRMAIAFETTELFDDFIAVCKNFPWFSDWLAAND